MGDTIKGTGKVVIMMMGKKSSEGGSYHLPAKLVFFVILEHIKWVLNLVFTVAAPFQWSSPKSQMLGSFYISISA